MSAACRLPAEWEPQSCVWLVPPHNVETWPGCFDQAVAQFDAFMAALQQATAIRTTDELGIPTNDSWVRDFGPMFVVRGRGVEEPRGQVENDLDHSAPRHLDRSAPLLAHNFIFNGWGNKYETRELDNAVPRKLARALGFGVIDHDLVLEGGSIDVNGRGTLLATEQCLLHPNRNPTLTRNDIEARLGHALGVSRIIWLPGGIEGDDTDGHVDDVARFIAPDTVAIIRAPPDHPDHAMTRRNLDVLREARDQDGHTLHIIELPVPEPITYDYPPDRFGPGGAEPVPASYANFLISNGHVFVPTFGQRSDDAALRVLDDAMPGYRIVPIRSRWLIVGLGALHCLSMQQPAVPAQGEAGQ